jgi:hypothetical protein
MHIFCSDVGFDDVPTHCIFRELLDELLSLDHKNSGLTGTTPHSRCVRSVVDEVLLSKHLALAQVHQTDFLHLNWLLWLHVRE